MATLLRVTVPTITEAVPSPFLLAVGGYHNPLCTALLSTVLHTRSQTVYFSLVVSPEFSWLSALRTLPPTPTPVPTGHKTRHVPTTTTSNKPGPRASWLSGCHMFGSKLGLSSQQNPLPGPAQRPSPRCPGELTLSPFCITEENDVGCPEGFELDTQGMFCVGEFFPGPDRNKLTSPGMYSPLQPAGKTACELLSPTQTRTNAQGVPAPAPIPAAMLLAISPAPAPMASPWLGTAGIVEVSCPGKYSSVLAPSVQ